MSTHLRCSFIYTKVVKWKYKWANISTNIHLLTIIIIICATITKEKNYLILYCLSYLLRTIKMGKFFIELERIRNGL